MKIVNLIVAISYSLVYFLAIYLVVLEKNNRALLGFVILFIPIIIIWINFFILEKKKDKSIKN